MKKIIISACLLGEYCRYDGKRKEVSEIAEHFKDYEIIPFCPEAPLFGTPRERISVLHVDGENKIFTDFTCRDVTQELINEINTFIKNNQDIDEIVLKSKSPSCGFGTTPILNEKKEILKYANGIAAEMLSENYPHVEIKDEQNFL